MKRLDLKINFSLKAIIIITILSFLTGYIIANAGLILFSLKALKISFAGDLVAALGNFTGGIIGGIVAYIVASYQVTKTFELEKTKKHEGKSAALRLINTELKSNLRLLKSMETQYIENDEKSFLPFISFDQWENCATSIGIEVNDTTLSSLMSAYKKLKLLKLGELKLDSTQYKQLISTIENITAIIDEDIQNIIKN